MRSWRQRGRGVRGPSDYEPDELPERSTPRRCGYRREACEEAGLGSYGAPACLLVHGLTAMCSQLY
jgi:hypothetical protein